ncbi:MAG: pentapeptide repeat-containing protein [Snowella sp.]|nr:pentapeptide repeat-containing protein [Snowella sp.]
MSSIHLLELQNPYPDCVSLNLNGMLDSSGSAIALSLTLSCQEQWKTLLAGRVKFGIRAGWFRVKIQGGEFVPHNLTDSDPYELISIHHQEVCWKFTAPLGQSLLTLNNQEFPLGSLSLGQSPGYLKGRWEINVADLVITDAEGLWRHDLTPIKYGILERVLARFLVQQYLQPISAIQLALGDSPLQETQPLARSPEPNPESLAALGDLIETIYQADSQNLAELAQIANLNPKTDLAGGNFLGANLSGVELNNANLAHTNFRGAILTDADLSEANLSYTNFSGADLSGAYLESANLRYADFHKGSLALTNLISTDLCHANLCQTTITHANFSGATVAQTTFSQNAGMTEELQQSLQARGAKFLTD